jgi:uncharacterized protein
MKLLWVCGVLVLFPGAVFAAEKMDKIGAPPATEIITLPKEEIQIVSAGREQAKLNVELALNPRDQERGLMGRKKLPKNTGMFFVFDEDRIPRFWMKNTLMPLDIVFVDRDGRIVWIHERAKPKDETFVSPPFPARAALEIRAGAAKAYRLNIGDLVLSPTLDRVVASGADTP